MHVGGAYDPPSVLPGPSLTLQMFGGVRRSQGGVLARFYLDIQILRQRNDDERLYEELNINEAS